MDNDIWASSRSTTAIDSITPVSIICIVFLGLSGACLHSYANGSFDAFVVSILFLVAGVGIVSLGFSFKKAELRVFLLTYAVCVFAGGLAQCYSLDIFGKLQSTTDANTFLRFLKPFPPYASFADLEKSINSPLAVIIWQQFYRLTGQLGFEFGPFTALLLNALIMGITGSITVRTAREIFGDDDWRLRRVGTLFALCGLFILFGSILLRDCFTTFFNSLVLWGLVRWLRAPTVLKLLGAIMLTSVSAAAMVYLRFESIVLFGLFWSLAFLVWFVRERIDVVRIIAICMVLISLLAGSSYLMRCVQTARQFQEDKIEGYSGSAAAAMQKESLGMKLVARQPLPVRMVMGSGYMMIFPIPLWGYLQPGMGEYHIIKGYHGIYQVLVLPLCFTGIVCAAGEFFRNREQSLPLVFTAAYLVTNLMAVVATSLEQRHLAQFMPALFILASVPDTREKNSRRTVNRMGVAWFIVVVLVHVAWMFARGSRV